MLDEVEIVATNAEAATEEYKTPWLEKWTIHIVRVEDDEAVETAEKLSRAFDPEHPGSWYADFKSETEHFVIFPGRIFRIRRRSEEYAKVIDYGLSLGIPRGQLDLQPSGIEQEA